MRGIDLNQPLTDWSILLLLRRLMEEKRTFDVSECKSIESLS